MIGPAIAGALIAATGLAPCFIINGLSFGAVIIMLALLHMDEMYLTPPAAPAKGQLREGFRYVLATPILAAVLSMMALIGTLTFEFQVSLPLIAQFTFKGDASSYAFLSAAMGLGAAAGGVFLAGQKGITPFKLVTAALLFGVAVLAASFMPSLFLTGVAMVLVGFASINFSSLGNSILQLSSDPQMRGRVMSFWTIAFLGSTTVGGPIVGWFAEVAGARWGLALGGFAALAATVVGAVSLRRFRPENSPSPE